MLAKYFLHILVMLTAAFFANFNGDNLAVMIISIVTYFIAFILLGKTAKKALEKGPPYE